MTIQCEPYLDQRARWPATGRHIMAHFDDESIIVYQAYRPSIGNYAVANQRFGGDWSFGRMSWIKPNFLWMMYRCGWARKSGQEVVLAIKLKRAGFDEILKGAVHSSYKPEHYPDRETWKRRVAESSVRLQWDPDHDPYGDKLARRAIQLGLRGETLRRYALDWCISIEDVSGFVREQYLHVAGHQLQQLELPVERVYPVDAEVAAHLGLDQP